MHSAVKSVKELEDTLKIKVTLANRVYPLNIKRSEEEKVRTAVKRINETCKKFEELYAVTDHQDVLAMAALQFATMYQGKLMDADNQSTQLLSDLMAMHQLIDNTKLQDVLSKT